LANADGAIQMANADFNASADVNDPTRPARPYAEILRDLADTAARSRGESGGGTLVDLMAVLAGPEGDLLDELTARSSDPADHRALEAIRESFAKDAEVIRGRLLQTYPSLFHSQVAT
jgi:hypothetical protein